MRATAKQTTPLSRPAQVVIETEIEILDEAIQLLSGVINDTELVELEKLHSTLLPVLEQNSSTLKAFLSRRGITVVQRAG